MKTVLSAALPFALIVAIAAQAPSQLRLYAGPSASALVTHGLLGSPPADASGYQVVPAPGLRDVRNDAQATVAPWVDSNGWRFRRGLTHANYDKLPPGGSLLAAAEAFSFGVDAILNPDAADLQDLGRLVEFLKGQSRPIMPAVANVGIVDDGSPEMGEAMNMLTRRNLLYRVVPRGDRSLGLTVEVGTPAFPRQALSNPSDFAARVREALGDDRRSVRVYGASTVILHLTGDDSRARLHLLSYSRNRNQASIRVRVLGRYQPISVAAFGGAVGEPPDDIRQPDNTATEFSVPAFNTIAIVDLARVR